LNIDIIEIETFKRSLKKEKINREDVDLLKKHLRDDPEKGDLIPNSGGLRKVRMSIENIGKRGGARVIYLYLSLKGRIYLITAYKKTNKENLTPDDLKIFRQLIKVLKDLEK
jgi:hypothetical protein